MKYLLPFGFFIIGLLAGVFLLGFLVEDKPDAHLLQPKPNQDLDMVVSIYFSPDKTASFTIKHSDFIPISGLSDYAKNRSIIGIIPSGNGSSFIVFLDNGTILVVAHRASDNMLVGKYYYLNNLPQD